MNGMLVLIIFSLGYVLGAVFANWYCTCGEWKK